MFFFVGFFEKMKNCKAKGPVFFASKVNLSRSLCAENILVSKPRSPQDALVDICSASISGASV